MDNNLRLLGIAKKGGMLEIGEEPVRNAAKSGKAKLIISACDAADASKRHAAEYAKNAGIGHCKTPYTKFEFSSVCGKGLPGMMAVMNTGIAAKFVSSLAAASPQEYGETAELLAHKAQKELQRRRETQARNQNSRTGKRRNTK